MVTVQISFSVKITPVPSPFLFICNLRWVSVRPQQKRHKTSFSSVLAEPANVGFHFLVWAGPIPGSWCHWVYF